MNLRRHKKNMHFEKLEPRQMLTGVVINEIHFNSDDNTKAEEFVELYNSGPEAVDLSGWEFTEGISYTFAPGAEIPAGGYVVVAQDPAVVLQEFGAIAIGQFTGKLSNDGENVELSDDLGNIVDEVSYKVGFPWPIAASGDGGSMELINPELDNNLGSSWRSSYFEPLFPNETSTIAAAEALSDLVHRWSFNGDLTDSVGGADGTLVDPEGIALLTSTELDVSANNGGDNSDQFPFTSGSYVDLPNGIISALGDNATFEWWGTVSVNRTWAEIFSFGRSAGGEDFANGANNEDYVTLIPQAGSGDLRITHRDSGTGAESFVDDNTALATGTEQHVAVTWNGQTNTQSLYLNGQFVGSSFTFIDLSDLDDVNNWLGRSQWPDPLFDGMHNEFRIYDRPLDGAEVAASFADGPDAVFNAPGINSFAADSSEILLGNSVTLTWDVTNFDQLSLNQGIGDVTGLTQVVVSPTETTTYTLSATNTNGVSNSNVTVTVNVPVVTPGTQNNVFAANAAPNIRKVKHDPAPTSGSPATVTAKVTDPDGVASVSLEYQIVLPGQYLPAALPVSVNDLVNSNGALEPTANPDYFDQANWTTVVMVDDGTGGDAVAGDNIFTAMVPAQSHRTLVRYRITVEDTLGATDRAPFADDNSLNFAYFVYDGVPEYRDQFNQVVADTETVNSVPVYHFLTRSEDMTDVMAYSSSDEIPQFNDARFSYNWSGTMVYDGVVYDNIHYRLRGANGRYLSEGKRSMRFRFNDGSYFQAFDQDGVAYPDKWRTLTTGKGFDNHSTLTYSLNEAVTLALSNLMGLPAAKTHWFQFRVIDDVAEAPDAWRGDFWGLNFAVETYDKRFLDGHGLEAGNLYKLINQSGDALRQQRYQAADAVDDGSDHDYIEHLLNRNSEDIEHRVNLEKYYLFHTLVEAVRHYDFWPSSNKNMVYYFEPDYLPENDNLGKLWLLPWDTDASWGPTWNEGKDVVYDALFENNNSSYSDGLLGPDYYNTLREMRDLIWQSDQIEGIVNELASAILPLEAADRARWQGAPNDAGSYNGLSGEGVTSITNLITDMMNFAFVGGNWPSGGSGPGGSVGVGGRAAYLDGLLANSGEESLIPDTPVISYIGDPGVPSDGLMFETTVFSDPQGSNTFGAVQWRISEVTASSAGLDPNEKFLDEWTASWDTGALATNSTQIAPPASVVDAGSMYRARVRHQDDTGRWSHWSDAIEFVPIGPADLPTLTITELHYHPNNPSLVDESDQEFIEILNTGNSTVDLSGVQIADFADDPYVFANGTSLGAGEYIVVARTPAVFESIYGTGVNLASLGYATSNLSNGGERISLLTAGGATIESFEYDDKIPWPEAADGDGPSLEIIDPLGDHTVASNWRASADDAGSPGFDGVSLDLAGDYDQDSDVDGSDFLAWQRAFGSISNPMGSGADGDISGTVDVGDLIVWQGSYGTSALAASLTDEPIEVAAFAVSAPVTTNESAESSSNRSLDLSGVASLHSSGESTPISQATKYDAFYAEEGEISTFSPTVILELAASRDSSSLVQTHGRIVQKAKLSPQLEEDLQAALPEELVQERALAEIFL